MAWWVDRSDLPILLAGASPQGERSVRPRAGAAQLVDCLVVMAVPLVSMLWESVDPAVALTERFGFADPASAAGWMGDALGDTWAIAMRHCDRLVISARNLLAWITTDDRRLIAKLSVRPALFQRLAETTTLTMWLQASGIPVAAPIPARDGRLRVELDNVSLGVSPVIDGDLLDVADLAQVTEAGRMLATLHEALASYPGLIGGRRPTGPEQLVHNDFRSANILHNGRSITAVLDFEEVTYSTRVADLAKAMILLGTRYHDWGPTSELVRETFVAGYRGQAPLTSVEQNELQRGITTILSGPPRNYTRVIW
ncbi:MAG: phosphotransferase [Pseudonocardiaceae bacterium]